jgi:hypothetical protein
MASVDCVEKRKQLNVDILNDWLKVGTMMIVSRFLELRFKKPNDKVASNEVWAKLSVFFLLGLTTYHIVTKQLLPLSNSNAVIQSVIDDWLKIGTALTVARLLEGEKLNNKWLMSSLYTLLGFTSFNIVGFRLVPKVDAAYQTALTTTMKTGTMMVVSRLLEEGTFDNKWLTAQAYTLIGFASYDLILADYVKPLQKLVRGELSLGVVPEKRVDFVPVPIPVQVQAQVKAQENAVKEAKKEEEDDEDEKDKDETKKVEGYVNLSYANY